MKSCIDCGQAGEAFGHCGYCSRDLCVDCIRIHGERCVPLPAAKIPMCPTCRYGRCAGTPDCADARYCCHNCGPHKTSDARALAFEDS